MTVNSLADALAIIRPEPPQYQIRPVVLWKMSKAINPTVLANPVSRLHMVGMCILRITGSFGLLRRKKSGLSFRDFIKTVG